ncbi:MAG: hypothetical protein H7Z15_09900 [Rhizobacter sp.]|nr:hypothetical protein [Rhizobacter sp.]
MTAKPQLFRLYSVGLACTLVGAWLTEVSGSLLPLALCASVTLMCTFQVVKSLRAKRAPHTGSR